MPGRFERAFIAWAAVFLTIGSPVFAQPPFRAPGSNAGIDTTITNMLKDDDDYLYDYKTLFLSVGNTLYGRFFTLGFTIQRYTFEVGTAAEMKNIRLANDSLRTNQYFTLNQFVNGGQPDSNIAMNVTTLRSFRREKFKFLGALCELDVGVNLKTWVYKNDKASVDTVQTIYTPQMFEQQSKMQPTIYVQNGSMDFSAGPSFKILISSGNGYGEPVFSIVGLIDVNCYFARKGPAVDLSLGIVIAPFSYY